MSMCKPPPLAADPDLHRRWSTAGEGENDNCQTPSLKKPNRSTSALRASKVARRRRDIAIGERRQGDTS
jgi:hypothetical protein